MAAVFALALLLLAAPARAALPDYSQPGPFPAAQRQIAVSGVNNAQFTAEVFYPGTAAAVNGTKLPILSYAHGYLGPVVTYVSFLRHLASWGILSVATNSEGGPTPNQTQYAYDILSCFDAVASDPFFAPAIDLNKKAVGGHSMGGGSSIAAAWLDKQQNNGSTTLKAYLGHAAAGSRLLVDGQNLTAVQLIRDLDLPIRLVSATGDTIVPYATNLAMYNNASNAPAQLVGVEGAGHCAFIDIEFTVPLCGAETLPRATARPLIRKLSTEFLLLHQNGLPPNPDANGPNELWNAVWGPGLQNQPQYSGFSAGRVAGRLLICPRKSPPTSRTPSSLSSPPAPPPSSSVPPSPPSRCTPSPPTTRPPSARATSPSPATAA
ncbi:Alpha/Beta hydrolase protein [Hyaloraphidium curvatum]|nr:Alpha/Beta hydrolase protein [Hyaloraphidium curvatum]